MLWGKREEKSQDPAVLPRLGSNSWSSSLSSPHAHKLRLQVHTTILDFDFPFLIWVYYSAPQKDYQVFVPEDKDNAHFI
jgi:hypothetical protein